MLVADLASARVLRSAGMCVLPHPSSYSAASSLREPERPHSPSLTLPAALGLRPACSRRWLQVPARRDAQAALKVPDLPPPPPAPPKTPSGEGIPYSQLTIGVPRETFPNEARVGVTPTGVAFLKKQGFAHVLVERGAGEKSTFTDAAYAAAGAEIVPDGSGYEGDIVLQVRPPSEKQVALLRPDQTLVSFIYPGINKNLVEEIRETGATAFAMDAVPRISRAQVFDALSSMANTAGYRAVLEAGNVFGRFFTGQVTAAGKIPPAKVLVSVARCASRIAFHHVPVGLSAVGMRAR